MQFVEHMLVIQRGALKMYSLILVADLYTGEIMGERIKRLADNAFIPLDEANTDYQAFLRWKSEGNEPLPADEETK